MTLDISVQERSVTHYIGIPVTARYSEFGAPDGPNNMVPRVYEWLADHEVIPLGGPIYIYRHLGSDDEPVDLTVAVPIAAPVTPTDGLVLGSLPSGTYVVGRHVGSPDELFASYAEVGVWAEAQGHRLDVIRDDSGALWSGFAEHFLTNPAEEPDLSKWVTELLFKTA